MAKNIRWHGADSFAELYDILEEMAFSVRDAMEQAEGIEECHDIYGELEELAFELEQMKDEADRGRAGEHQAMIDELTEEYWSSRI